ncbi:MAG TPA: CvpA family protein [Chitinophagaceae bacterium]|nr:CvpA family protein [Chitinophagaceae bacterium]
MIIDLIFVVILILAIIKGYQRGLIVGIFSFLAIIIGLAAAIKLSTVVAGYIGQTVKVSEKWLPIISFAVVFIIIVLLVRWGANIIQRTAEAVALGWLNRLGGIVFYAAIYITVFSVILFYLEQIHIIKQESISKSATYSFVQPWGPKAINAFAAIIPWFRDMFEELERFFEGVSHDISEP